MKILAILFRQTGSTERHTGQVHTLTAADQTGLHNFTQHTQPITQQWTTVDVSYNQVPIAQTQAAVTYPTLTSCDTGTAAFGFNNRLGYLNGFGTYYSGW